MPIISEWIFGIVTCLIIFEGLACVLAPKMMIRIIHYLGKTPERIRFLGLVELVLGFVMLLLLYMQW